MISTLIKIRIIQLKRQIISLGFLYSILIIVFFLFCIYVFFKVYQVPDKAAYLSGTIVLIISGIHTARTDNAFIHKHIDLPEKTIFTEYFIFSLPFSITCLFTQQWFYFPLLMLLFFFIACLKINARVKTFFSGLSKIIPAYYFEWLSGIRKNFIMIILCIVGAYATCWFKIVPLAFLWLLAISVSAFFQECESLPVLFSSGLTARKFLLEKIEQHCALLIIICTPVLIINSIFCTDMIFVNIIFLILQIILLVFSILLKYTSYSPNDDLRANSLLISIAALGSIIPFLTPIPLIMCFRNYSKAIHNLKFYLDDQYS